MEGEMFAQTSFDGSSGYESKNAENIGHHVCEYAHILRFGRHAHRSRAFVISLVPGLTMTAPAIIGKVVGCGGGLLLTKFSPREATVGVGMISRGEVGLIIAGIGLTSGFIDPQACLASVMAVSLTTIIASPIPKIQVGHSSRIRLFSDTIAHT